MFRMASSIQIEQYNTQQLGIMFQNANPLRIISLSWEEEFSEGPTLFVFKDVEEIVNMMERDYSTPFVMADLNHEMYTKRNSILKFNDSILEMIVTVHKSESVIYRFYNQDAFHALKGRLVKDSISWEAFEAQ